MARPVYDTREERFWNRVNKSGPTQPHMDTRCWEWAGYVHPRGYGVFSYRCETVRAHRLSWMLNRGPIPTDKIVCHKCDYRRCVRPEHLFLGTYLDNNADRASKGRSRDQRGERNNMSKLTEEKVREIFALRKSGLSQRKIAPIVGCNHENVGRILRGEQWVYLGLYSAED